MEKLFRVGLVRGLRVVRGLGYRGSVRVFVQGYGVGLRCWVRVYLTSCALTMSEKLRIFFEHTQNWSGIFHRLSSKGLFRLATFKVGDFSYLTVGKTLSIDSQSINPNRH